MNGKKVYNKKNTKRIKRILSKTFKKGKNKKNIKKRFRKTNKKIKGGSMLGRMAGQAVASTGKSIISSGARVGTDAIDAAKGISTRVSVAKKSTLLKYIALLSKYGLLSMVGFLLYAPSYVINIPNNTLENLLPPDICKYLFNDQFICESKLKCLLGLCGDESEESIKPINLYNGGGGKRGKKNPKLSKKLLLKQRENRENKIQIKYYGGFDEEMYARENLQNEDENKKEKIIEKYIELLGPNPPDNVNREELLQQAKNYVEQNENNYQQQTQQQTLQQTPQQTQQQTQQQSFNNFSKDSPNVTQQAQSSTEKSSKFLDTIKGTGKDIYDKGKDSMTSSMQKAYDKSKPLINKTIKTGINTGVETAKQGKKLSTTITKASKNVTKNLGESGSAFSKGRIVEGTYKGLKAATKLGVGAANTAARAAEGATKILEKPLGLAANIMTKQASKNLENQGISIKNIDQGSCKNKGNETYCNFRKPNKYGPKHASTETGILKRFLGFETKEESENIIKNNSKIVSAMLKDKMKNKTTGKVQPIKVESYMSANFSDENLKKMIMLFNMLELLFPTSEATEVNYVKPPEKLDVLFPWTVYGSTMGIKDKADCLYKHVTKSELTEQDYKDDIDEKTGKHKCFYCKDCTLQNTAFRVFNRYVMSEEKTNLDYIMLSLYHMLKEHFDIYILDQDTYDKVNILTANILSKETDITNFLEHKQDSYRNSYNTNPNDIRDNSSGYSSYGSGDLLNINGKKIHIRNAICQIPEMTKKSDMKDIGELESVELSYQILKELDLQNIISNILIKKNFSKFFDDEIKSTERRKNSVTNYVNAFRSSKNTKSPEIIDNVFLNIDPTSITVENIKKCYESFINNDPKVLSSMVGEPDNLESILKKYNSVKK